MKKLTNTKKILFICIALNAGVFMVYGFLLWAIYAKASLASSLVTEVAQDVEKDEELRSIKSSLAENETAINDIDEFFVQKDGVVSFISSLEKLGGETQVKLSIGSVSVEEEDEVAGTEILNLNLETEGSWQGTFAFFSLLENLPYRIEIIRTSLILSGANESILFSEADRVPAPEEVWRGNYQVRVHKLRQSI